MKFSFSRFPVFPSSRFLILSVVTVLLIPHASAQVVDIPDPNLERAIRAELELPSHLPITQQEMLRLFSLSANAMQIENLAGIEYAHNLEDLTIRNNPISDLTPIEHLMRLERLTLNGIPIKDLIFLKDLTQLRHLNLFACEITDITPLQNLTKLVFLSLEANRIADLSPLSNLTALETLRLGHNFIVDISPLANLTQLKHLNLYDNLILDFSPVQGLSIPDFRYDEPCLLPDPPIRDRIENRSRPSVFSGWGAGANLSLLSPEDFRANHDLYWGSPPFGLHFLSTPPWYILAGDIDDAIARREELLSKNPNMIFLVQIKINLATYREYPEDWFGWVRDENGKPVRGTLEGDSNLIDVRLPEVQDIIVRQAIAVSKCGLYDGIMFDWWPAAPFGFHSYNADGSLLTRRRVEENIPLSIIQRIRPAVPDDFLILCNRNRNKIPLSAPYINGAFMETLPSEKGYTRADIIEIETNLIWLEQNLREPQINCLQGYAIPTEPRDSPRNRRWMRLFTTMSLTLSDGYVKHTRRAQGHLWHPFWDANLGQPIGPTAQRYQEDIEGLYIREFTNGWAVYNRSGVAQTITLPMSTAPVSDRGDNSASTTHLLPDLDGEIYLKAKNPADVNGDGVVNVLDLIQVANGLGKSTPDPNGDGVVNILGLTFVAKHLGQNAAAPSQLALIESIPTTVKEVSAVQHALAELEAIPNKSHGVQIAIELLRHYLSIAAPNVQETKLLSNYPNPFNPDTWIPYQLSEESTVTVKIYDVTGSLVRTIQVGHKPAGYYHTRERAIYWDGRNQNREPVSSGVYFYTLNTDTDTQTRRMVILK